MIQHLCVSTRRIVKTGPLDVRLPPLLYVSIYFNILLPSVQVVKVFCPIINRSLRVCTSGLKLTLDLNLTGWETLRGSGHDYTALGDLRVSTVYQLGKYSS